MKSAREALRGAGAVIRHPELWGVGIVEFRRFVPDGWWRRRPFLPVPDAAMVAFRTTTQYGDPDHRLEPDDLIAWLRWCKAENRRRRVR